MPVLLAQRGGPCAACGALVLKGERIEYTLGTGPRHLACADKAAELRRNQHAASCVLCGFQVPRGAGALSVTETCEGGAYTRRWAVSCVDFLACHERIVAALPGLQSR
ncbi:hypothetical protein [Corallococcus exiguus]|uniref:hypothetical protein n=1 Tax=Corallococcus exiguus TaxID=83462 RepID=UPI001494FF8F|nr:hypothetical protein [Corallococcus exiguus]NPD27455.1 hypothetical protein [Corallococcus exiguus]